MFLVFSIFLNEGNFKTVKVSYVIFCLKMWVDLKEKINIISVSCKSTTSSTYTNYKDSS